MQSRFPIDTAQQLTEYVRALRKWRGQTQADVARILGVSTARVATIEKDVGRLSSSSLLTLLQTLGAQLELKTEVGISPYASAPEPDARTATPTTRRGARGGEW